MKCSIIIPVLNSHEIVRRQLLHFEQLELCDTEILIVDDGSEPPLEYHGDLPVRIIYTNDKRAWTWALARNRGAREAQGDYLLMYDVDHFIMQDTLDMLRDFEGQKIQFKREFAVLLEDGSFCQDLDVLVQYGFPRKRFEKRGFQVSPLPNNFVIRKDIFFEIGGYREDLFKKSYPQGEDRSFKWRWSRWIAAGKGQVHTERPTIYMFPNGYLCGHVDHNPFGLFHNLSRATRRNPRYNEAL
jgi:glycosyltransferase involved in cell wall biosynthesis